LKTITNKENTSDKPLIKKQKAKTLLQHIEQIIEYAENSKLSDKFYQNAKTNINFVAKTMNLTSNQAVIFSLFMEYSSDNRILISELSKFLGCRNIKEICMMRAVDVLESRHLVRCCRKKEGGICYLVPHEIVKAVKENIVYQPEKTTGLNTDSLFNHIERLFDERSNNEITGDTLFQELCSLLDDNSSLVFCRQMNEYKKAYSVNNFLLLLLFCHRFINLDEDCIGFDDFEDLFDIKRYFRDIKTSLQNGENDLIRDCILEYTNDNGFTDKDFYRISSTAKEKLFAEINIKIHQAENKKGLILHQNITLKQMFYNKREQEQIAQLSSLLGKDNFRSVQEKLEKSGMRKGFACLFYGAPGTGKTETA
jgi:hypothetical protein